LKQKVEQKLQGCPERSAQAAGPAHNNTQPFLHHFLFLTVIKQLFFTEYNFFKTS